MKILNIWGKLPDVFIKVWDGERSIYYKTVLVNGKYRLYKLNYNYSDSYKVTRHYTRDMNLINAVKNYVGLK